MSYLTKEIKEKRERAWNQMRSILDRAEAEKRDLTGTEESQYQALSADLDGLDERMRELEADAERRAVGSQALTALGIGGNSQRYSDRDRATAEAFRSAVLRNDRTPIHADLDVRSGSQPAMELRAALATGTGNTSPSFARQLVRHMVEGGAVLLAGATVVRTETGSEYKVPVSTADSTSAIVPEGTTIPESAPTTTPRALNAFKYGHLVQVTTELATDAEFDLLAWLAEQSGRALGTAIGADLLTGAGTTEPLGVLGLTTAGKTGGTGVTGSFAADDLIDLYHSVSAPYARSSSAAWMVNNTTLAAIRKLKDTQDRYLFDVNVPAGSGASGSLLGRPVFVDPNVPNVGLGAKSVLFGDWSKVYVRLAGGVRFERSDDFAFDDDLVTFRALQRADGLLVDQTGAIKHFAGGAS